MSGIPSDGPEATAGSEGPGHMVMKGEARPAMTGTESGSSRALGPSDRVIQRIATADIRPAPISARKRLNLEELQELSDSIRENGVLQPILLRRANDGGLEVVAGYRRWLAASLAEVDAIPAIVLGVTSDARALEIALIENLQRRDLTIIEEAEANRALIETYGRSHDQVAALIGRSRSFVSNSLRLLTLPDDVKSMLEEGKITAGHARALLATDQPAALAARVVAEQLTVRQAEQLARSGDDPPKARKRSDKSDKPSDPGQVMLPGESEPSAALAEALSAQLGAQVRITGSELIVQAGSLTDLVSIGRRIRDALVAADRAAGD